MHCVQLTVQYYSQEKSKENVTCVVCAYICRSIELYNISSTNWLLSNAALSITRSDASNLLSAHAINMKKTRSYMFHSIHEYISCVVACNGKCNVSADAECGAEYRGFVLCIRHVRTYIYIYIRYKWKVPETLENSYMMMCTLSSAWGIYRWLGDDIYRKENLFTWILPPSKFTIIIFQKRRWCGYGGGIYCI